MKFTQQKWVKKDVLAPKKAFRERQVKQTHT
jgi:hypothetical protein